MILFVAVVYLMVMVIAWTLMALAWFTRFTLLVAGAIVIGIVDFFRTFFAEATTDRRSRSRSVERGAPISTRRTGPRLRRGIDPAHVCAFRSRQPDQWAALRVPRVITRRAR